MTTQTAGLAPLRLFDIAAAIVMFVVCLPSMMLIALIVLLDDGRPVLSRQAMIGRNGRPFLIYKFRSLRCGANRAAAITSMHDSRLTRAGGWLRRLSLDGLPQLINVLRGEMSLVGSRPEAPDYVEVDNPLWRTVLASRPGITDLASLAFRNEEEILESAADPDFSYRSSILPVKLRLNVRYQQSRTLPRDLKLLWLKARYSFFPRGYNRERILRSLRA